MARESNNICSNSSNVVLSEFAERLIGLFVSFMFAMSVILPATLSFKFYLSVAPLRASLILKKKTSNHLGVASGRPPSTGIVAPVVGVWRVARKRTARATWVAVILARSKFRLR